MNVMKRPIFDMYDRIPAGVDIDTIIPTMNINPEDIKKAVLAKINGNSKKKGGFRKRFTLTLIAAAVGVGLLGTVAVGAMGGFNQAFGERFAGEKVNGIYPGGNVDIKTNDSIKAELLGIAGDHNKVMAAVTVTKNDGTPLVDYNDIENILVVPSADEMNCLDENGEVREQLPFYLSNNTMNNRGKDGNNIQATVSEWTKLQARLSNHDSIYEDEDGYHCFDYADYDMRLTDRNTVKMIYFIGREDFSLTGETMSVNQKSLYILHKEKMIFDNSVDIHLTDDNGMIQTAFDAFAENAEQELETVRKYKDSLKDNQTIIVLTDADSSVENYNDKTHNFVKRTLWIVTVDKIDIDFSGSWKLNYKSTVVDLQPADHLPCPIKDIKANSFDIEVTFAENDILDNIIRSDVVITIKNGEKIKGIWWNVSSDSSSASIAYYRHNDYNNMLFWSNINAEEITSVTIDGVEILK